MAFQNVYQPSPSNGLDLVSPIDQMEPASALELVNIIPGPKAPSLRKGYTQLCDTGAGGQLNCLYTLPLADGSYKMVAGDSSKLWEVSTASASNITGATTPSTGDWNAIVFSHNLYLCNGTDNAQVYSGTGNSADISFTGPTLSTLINVSSYKERLYFIEKNTLKFHYGNSQATGGSALTAYDLKYTFKRGGKLLFAGSWTNQLATTSADLFMACSSEGEILFYTGSYPGDASWGLVARFVIGKPLSYRSFIRVNSDVWIVTEQGIVPISTLFQLGLDEALNSVAEKVNPLISYYASEVGFSNRWHGVHCSVESKVYLVIPTSGTTTIMLVYSTDRKAWGNYQLYGTGDAISIAVMDEQPYYASSDGKVYKGEYGYNDKGNAITFNGRCAFNFFGNRSNYKAFKDIRPLMLAPASISMQLGLDTNFQRISELDTITIPQGTFTPYGSLYGSLYSSDATYIYERYATRGQGHCAAVRFSGSVMDSPMEFYGFEVRFDQGAQV